LRDRGTGRSLTLHLGRVRADLVRVRVPVPDQGLLLVGPGDRAELMDPAVPVARDRVDLLLVGRGDRAELMGLVARAGRLAPVVLDPVALGPVDRELPDLTGRVDLGDLAALVDLVQTGRAALVGLEAPVDLAAPVDRADLAGRDLTGRAAQVDRHRRLTSNTVSTTGVARNGAAPGTHRTDSARRTTARLHHRRNAASGGTMDLRLEVRRLTGTARRLLAAGTGRHLLAAGTVDGTGPLAT
jgi:hypothetical protein